MRYKFLLMFMTALNQTIINGQTFEAIAAIRDNIASFAQENLSINDFNAGDVLCAASAVGIWTAYVLHKNKQDHQQKFENMHVQLHKRNIVVYEIKYKFTSRLACYGAPRDMQDPMVNSYIKQLFDSYYVLNNKKLQLTAIIGTLIGIWGFAIFVKVRKH